MPPDWTWLGAPWGASRPIPLSSSRMPPRRPSESAWGRASCRRSRDTRWSWRRARWRWNSWRRAATGFGNYQRMSFYQQMMVDAGLEDARGDVFTEAIADAIVISGDEETVEERVRGLPGFGVDELLADVVQTGESAERDRARTFALPGPLAREPGSHANAYGPRRPLARRAARRARAGGGSRRCRPTRRASACRCPGRARAAAP